jgi:hypothetical protein
MYQELALLSAGYFPSRSAALAVVARSRAPLALAIGPREPIRQCHREEGVVVRPLKGDGPKTKRQFFKFNSPRRGIDYVNPADDPRKK